MTTINFDGRFSVAQYPGVAFWLKGWEQQWEPLRVFMVDEDGEEYEDDDPYGEGEWVDNPEGRIRAVMVGDDREHLIDPEDLTEINDESYCSCCGQIGCTADGR